MDMSVDYMLTTYDNPFNPFTQYDEWYAWDYRAQYHTPGLLARVAFVSDELSDVDQRAAINAAIDDVVTDNPLGIHRKVTRDDFPSS